MALTTIVQGPPGPNGFPTAPIQQVTSYTTNGYTTDTTGGVSFPLQNGVPMNVIYPFQVIPAESEIQVVDDVVSRFSWGNTQGLNPTTTIPNWAIAIAQAYAPGVSSAAGFTIPLNTIDIVSVNPSSLIPNISEAITYNGIFPQVLLDCERSISLSFVNLSGSEFSAAATSNTTVMTMQCIDYRGVPDSQIVTIESGTAGTIIVGNPTSLIVSISFSTNPFSGYSAGGVPYILVGNSANIGLPYFLDSVANVVSANISNPGAESGSPNVINLSVTDGDGSIWSWAGISAGTTWRYLITSTSTLASLQNLGADTTRGAVVFNVNADVNCDGYHVLTMAYNVSGANSEITANLQNLNPSSLGILHARQTTQSTVANPQYAWPYLTQYDLTGLQWNNLGPNVGDNPAITAYIAALNG